MDMTVNTLLHIVLLEQIQNLTALIALVQRRVVQEHQLALIPCRLQGCLQAHDFSVHNLSVMTVALFFFEEPASCAADGIVISIEIAVIVEDVHILKSICLTASL